MLVIQISKHCLEQILARQGEVKGNRAKLRNESEGIFIFFNLRWSQVTTEKMSFQVLLENCQGFSIPDEGGSCMCVCECVWTGAELCCAWYRECDRVQVKIRISWKRSTFFPLILERETYILYTLNKSVFLPPFFMSWTQRSKTFSMYTKGLFLSNIVHKSVLVSTSLSR